MADEQAAEYRWRRTGAPFASSRTDDIWFLDANEGWAVNSNGHILHTADGGDSWRRQLALPGAYLRCVGFANGQLGFAGTLTPGANIGMSRYGFDGSPRSMPPATPAMTNRVESSSRTGRWIACATKPAPATPMRSSASCPLGEPSSTRDIRSLGDLG